MIWYPYAQMKNMHAPLKVDRAEGVYLYTDRGKLIDSVSSWWSAIHGYNNPELNEAAAQQLNRFSHVMLGGLTHGPAQELSDKLADMLPEDLDYCFYSDSGSVGVEVALKMALQYNVNKGSSRRTILALKNAYHGDTFKAMEVGDDEDYHFAFPTKNGVVHIPTTLDALEKVFAEIGDTLSCFIVEPLLQGAGGMLVYGVEFLRRARELCDRYDVLLIFDEVATGFGRTGNRFVSDLVCPDIIILGKALTGGYTGHAVTVSGRRVFEAFYGDDYKTAFMHGPTFMGNALACTVARKSIELFERENYMSKIAHIEEFTRNALQNLADERIREVRVLGGMACIELTDGKYHNGYAEFAASRGVFSRPFGNIIYATVPYIITDEQLSTVLNTMKEWFTCRLHR